MDIDKLLIGAQESLIKSYKAKTHGEGRGFALDSIAASLLTIARQNQATAVTENPSTSPVTMDSVKLAIYEALDGRKASKPDRRKRATT